MDSKDYAMLLERVFFPSNMGIIAGLILLLYLMNSGNIINNTIAFLVIVTTYISSILCFKRLLKDENRQYFTATLIVTLIFSAMNAFMKISPEFTFGILSLFTLSLIALLIRPHWKISGHSAVITGACTWLSIIDIRFLPLFIFCPIIYWSRLNLQRHTPAQVIAGIILGLLIPIFAWMVLI